MLKSVASLRRRSSVGAVACLALSAHAMQAQAASTALRVGDAFPRVAGQTVSGLSVELPAPNAARPVVVIVSFSRQGGKDAQRWDELLTADRTSGRIDVVVVAEIESVPRLIRGTVAYTIRRSVPADLRNRMIVLDRDAELWKKRLSVTSNDSAYVVLVDVAGKVDWMRDGGSAETGAGRLRDAIRRTTIRTSARIP